VMDHSDPRADTTSALTQRELLLVDAVAARVMALLHAQRPARLVDAATLAAKLGVSRDFVYAHASELGAQRIGGGLRGRLRFDLDHALATWTSRPGSEEPHKPTPTASTHEPARRRRQRMRDCSGLLPVRGHTIAPDGTRGLS
jgi:hypothetical protein